MDSGNTERTMNAALVSDICLKTNLPHPVVIEALNGWEDFMKYSAENDKEVQWDDTDRTLFITGFASGWLASAKTRGN